MGLFPVFRVEHFSDAQLKKVRFLLANGHQNVKLTELLEENVQLVGLLNAKLLE